ncbi:hypothetical protein [Saccharopolyspora mangrovi]|uniref:Integral membrane protein n=1 Tax=Saccharopolyspora mangrovi TaxID=3082379 RepID=A0ABU6A9Q8_9PSEU|nr:hypothetical protein [Saccharopolyspora sp. S2-29]MEB3368271.1 hypothetical protein [Saccharopolyspora sp. S2-29]
MSILLLKLFLAPVLVVASTLAGRRWGPSVTGVLVGLPVVAGPILLISYLQHGAAFISDAAVSCLLGLVSIAAFAVVFSHVGRRFGWFATLTTSWTVVLAVDFALSLLAPVTALVAVGLTIAATGAAMILMPSSEPHRSDAPPPSLPSWDLPSRAVATAVLVFAVTTASGALGPNWTGLLAPFPTAISVVATFAHAQCGPAATARTLSGAVLSLFSFATFCLSVALLVRPIGGAAFLIGAVVTSAVQVLVMRTRTTLHDRRSTLQA